MFSFTRIPFWVHICDPQPCLQAGIDGLQLALKYRVGGHRSQGGVQLFQLCPASVHTSLTLSETDVSSYVRCSTALSGCGSKIDTQMEPW